jgi:hypothetical protein
MNTHIQNLLQIRPVLPVEPADDSEMAHFQVYTLRPVLKMQNELILDIFKDYLQEVKMDFSKRSEKQQRDFIENALTKQNPLKFTLIGTVIGHFTSEEYTFYQSHRQEITKRLVRFLSKRIFEGMSL